MTPFIRSERTSPPGSAARSKTTGSIPALRRNIAVEAPARPPPTIQALRVIEDSHRPRGGVAELACGLGGELRVHRLGPEAVPVLRRQLVQREVERLGQTLRGQRSEVVHRRRPAEL